MIIVDTALQKREKENNPIMVAMIGAGAMAKHIAWQIINATPGMHLAVISNRTIEKAEKIYQDAAGKTPKIADNLDSLDNALNNRQYAVTNNPSLLALSEKIDAIIEVTGNVEFGAKVTLQAIKNKKHVISMNAELNATIGPILKAYAEKENVIVTDCDGDQPGVIMNLYRFVRSIGCKPVLAGNIKGLQDPYRNPDTQKEFAKKYNQNVNMVTSFADGTKVSFEMALVANATGLKAGVRGMYGPECKHVTEAINLFPREKLLNGGIVDYILGAKPSPGVFVIGYSEVPIQQHYFNYLKMGKGPLYVFYRPYHLCSFEVPLTVARVVLFNDPAVTAIGPPVCEVITTAKSDLKKGQKLDGIGGFTCYGQLENSEICQKENLLPMGLSSQCTLIREIKKDHAITYSDIILPEQRLSDKLHAEQNVYFNNRKN